ncbi:MAG: PepSY-associated TM helix domain-containing protein [Acidobacteriota bacterium]|nr:PepSY-associated TM helix domain-containing protein [Acidobacteriota bacterium]
MKILEQPRSVVRMGPDQLKVFLDQRTLIVGLPGGRVVDEHARRRFAFFEVNYLHLNHGKGFWTWFADLYAVGLLVLACTGIFIITGKKGLGGRGRWLLIAGLAIPIVYLILTVWL